MSKLNGDKARFQKNRLRKLHYRQRVRALFARSTAERIDAGTDVNAGHRAHAPNNVSETAATLAVESEGGPSPVTH
jgi:hypothetical protein